MDLVLIRGEGKQLTSTGKLVTTHTLLVRRIRLYKPFILK